MSAKQWLFRLFIGPLDPWYYKQKPQPDLTRPLEMPIPETDVVIGVVFGTARISKPAIVWWGDLKILKVAPEGGGKK